MIALNSSCQIISSRFHRSLYSSTKWRCFIISSSTWKDIKEVGGRWISKRKKKKRTLQNCNLIQFWQLTAAAAASVQMYIITFAASERDQLTTTTTFYSFFFFFASRVEQQLFSSCSRHNFIISPWTWQWHVIPPSLACIHPQRYSPCRCIPIHGPLLF
jgi:hypothetical protein